MFGTVAVMVRVPYIDVLEAEAASFAQLIGSADPASPVAGCPGWTLADLAHHLGGIHRWARQAVLVGPGDQPRGPDDPRELYRWFVHGAADLVQTLRSADPAQPCWTIAPPHEVRFWMRRQALETTIHRWDAATCAGVDATIEPAVALDGIEEVLDVLLPRQVRLGRLPPIPSVVHLLTNGRRMVVRNGTAARGGDEPVGAVEASPEVMLLLLWRRITAADPRVIITGNESAVRTLLGRALTP